MASSFSWQGFDALSQKLRRLADPDATPLMEQWEKVIVEDNRKGVLEGVDMNGDPMPPLRYRGGLGQTTKGRGKARRGTVAVGAHNPGPGGNLTNAEYRKLTGPRLAPRREQSRIITNLQTGHGREADGRWFAVGAWLDVVSKKGVPFLKYHFEGMGRNPRYDLRGVRAWGQELARKALQAWVKEMLGE